MTEKEQFIQSWEREFQTTLKVLRAYPTDKLDLRPHERSRSAKELAWTLAAEESQVIGGAIRGSIDFSTSPKPPATLQEMISAYERNHKELAEKVKNLSDAEFQKIVKFPVAPGRMGDLRCADICWMLMMDSVHHRGQFSVYLRMAGGKVPSIYGPSADEPWM
jgi:uncharacterized damage-inducible protein DinB